MNGKVRAVLFPLIPLLAVLGLFHLPALTEAPFGLLGMVAVVPLEVGLLLAALFVPLLASMRARTPARALAGGLAAFIGIAAIGVMGPWIPSHLLAPPSGPFAFIGRFLLLAVLSGLGLVAAGLVARRCVLAAIARGGLKP